MTIAICHFALTEQLRKIRTHKIAIFDENKTLSYTELNKKSNQLANFLLNSCNVNPEEKVGVYLQNSIEQVIAIIGTLNAGATYIPIDPKLPEERIRAIIDDASISVLISSKNHIRTLNRLQWDCKTLDSFICMDSTSIYDLKEEQKNVLMSEMLWEHLATSNDRIGAGGWYDSYKGEKFSAEEMEEYSNNVFNKLEPYLGSEIKILEIGCSSGLSMYRLAPKVALYYGIDISESIINQNKNYITEHQITNIKLETLSADQIDQLFKDYEGTFDIVIFNSVIQCFDGHNYLRQVLKKVIKLGRVPTISMTQKSKPIE